MIVAHLADLHLGHEAYGATLQGRNARSRDVEQAFHRAVQELLRLEPDLVLIAGDVVDHPVPGPAPLVTLTRGLNQIREALPDTPVLMVAGERDTPIPRSDPGIMAMLDTLPGVEAASGAPRSVFLSRLKTHVLLIPNRSARRPPFPAVRPDPSARFNLLVVHARVGKGEEGLPIEAAEWDYVALGHEHSHRQVGPRAHFAGALERVTANPWAEAMEEKGFLSVEMESGDVTFHPIQGRSVVELAPVRITPGQESDINRKIRDTVGVVPGGIDGKLVKMPVIGLPRGREDTIDPELMAGLRSRALHLHVEFRDAVEAGLAPEVTDHPDSSAFVEEACRIMEDVERIHAPLVRLAEEVDRSAEAGKRHAQGVSGANVVPPARILGVLGWSPRGGAEAVPVGLDAVLSEASAVLARARGGDRLEVLIRLLSPEAAPAPASRPSEGPILLAEFHPLINRIRELEAMSGNLRSMETELQELRAETAVVLGDVEEAVADWLRERQDADNQLRAYRDRARELKARIAQIEEAGSQTDCPTCGRPLEDQAGDVLQTLKEELEAVVQDGQWWKRRREQVEEKPESLREQEAHHHRLQASVEGLAEKIEGVRVGERDLGDLRERARTLEARLKELGVPLDDTGAAAPRRPLPEIAELPPGSADARLAIRVVRKAEDLLRVDSRLDLEVRAGRILNRVGGGRLSGLRTVEGHVELLRDGTPLRGMEGWETFVAGLAVRMALADALEIDVHVASLKVGPDADRLPPEVQALVLEECRRLAAAGVEVRVRSDGQIISRNPERFDGIVEMDSAGGEARESPVGHPVLSWSSGDQVPRSRAGAGKKGRTA
jgi:DNA repair exonuclease SbcCD nuclease subunit